MNIRFFCVGALCVSLLAGCSSHAVPPSPAALSAGEKADLTPLAPEGMRLGAPYRSALDEPCFEVYGADGPAIQAGAFCSRDGEWTLQPFIYLRLPSRSAFAPDAPESLRVSPAMAEDPGAR